MALVFRLLIESPDLDAIPFLLQNAMLFNLYQLSSIGILERLDSLTHSVLNALKRFSGIFLSVIILRETLRLNHALGLVLTFIGVALYKIGGRLSSSRKEQKFVLKAHSLPVFAGTLWFCVCFILVPIYGGKWMTSNSGIGSAVSRVGISPATPRLENSSGQEARRWPSATEGDVYLKVLYDAIDMEKTYSSKMAKDVFSYSGGNTGNLVWQHSGLHRLPDFSNVKMCNGSQPACAAKEAIGPDSHVVVFRPVANIFHDKNVRGFKFYVDLLNEGGKVIFVGLGVQAYFHDGHYDEKKYANSEPELKPRDFQLEPEAKELLQTMQKKKNKMLTRGNFTTMALKRAGYDYAISAGCPSLMLSMETRLGRVLEPKYRAVANRIGDKSLKVAINIVPEPGLMRVYIGLLRDYPNSLIYAQTSNDLRRLKALNVSEERIRVFTNIEKWRESLEEMDVAFGLRIHGNMIALGSSLPAFVVAPDYRVLELVQRMKVPHVSIMEANLFAEHIDVAKLVANAEFDGEEFDANRCEIAGLYRELFGSYGFDVSPSVRRISEIC